MTRRTRSVLTHAAVGLLTGLLVLAAVHVRQSTSSPPAARAESFAETDRLLDRPLPDVRFDAVPFDQAVQRLRELSGVEIDIDAAGLRRAGWDPTTPVRYFARRPTLGDALDGIFDLALPPGFQGQQVGRPAYLVQAGRVVIKAISGGEDTVVRAYDVRDLLRLVTRLDNQHVGIGILEYPGELPTGHGLATLVADSVDPDGWRSNGGGLASAAYFNGRLVVDAPWRFHRGVRRFLAALRHPAPPETPVPGPEVLRWDDRLGQWVSPEPDAAEAALAKVIADLHLRAASFDEAVDQLRDAAGATIFLETLSLDLARFDRHRPVDLRLRNIPLARALDLLLAAYRTADGPELFCGPVGHVILLTTRGRAFDDATYTRVYDLLDLRRALERRRGAPMSDADWDAWPAEHLVGMLRDTVDPKSWRDNGGSLGAARIWLDSLVVTQTYENHQKVRRLIDALRIEAAGPTTASTTRPSD